MKNPIYLTFTALLTAALLLAGCASGPKPPRMTLNIEAGTSINPDLHDRASPVVIYIYNLKTNSIFNHARFIELYSNGKDVLGVDLLAVQEFEISPGESMNLVQRGLPVETRHIGVIAAFRDIDSATWRGSIDIEPGEKFDAYISIDKLSIAIQKQ